MSAFQTRQPALTVVQSRSRSRESAGINRSGVANERVVRERPSQPLGPEPYAEDGNVLGVAWARGTCRPAIELRNLHRPACRPCPAMGKATRKAAQNGESPEDAAESENLSMHGNSRRENREIPSASPKWGTVGEGHWPYVRHVRGWEVRWSHSTYETGEQNRNTGSGVRGGKGATEGEDTQHTLEPDTVPDCSSPYACCASTACKDL